MVHGITIDGCNPSNREDRGVYDSLARGRVTAVNATNAIWEGFEETVDRTAAWHRRFRERADALVQVRTAQDIVRAHETGRVGIVLGRQNLSPIGNDVLSHVGDRSSPHAIEVSDQPVAFTHANLREFFDHPRNKPAELIRALETNAEIPNVASALRNRGYGEGEIDGIMGGNWMRLYREVWGA